MSIESKLIWMHVLLHFAREHLTILGTRLACWSSSTRTRSSAPLLATSQRWCSTSSTTPHCGNSATVWLRTSAPSKYFAPNQINLPNTDSTLLPIASEHGEFSNLIRRHVFHLIVNKIDISSETRELSPEFTCEDALYLGFAHTLVALLCHRAHQRASNLANFWISRRCLGGEQSERGEGKGGKSSSQRFHGVRLLKVK
jgi:hypothetical protein